jgi:hypothetical protein
MGGWQRGHSYGEQASGGVLRISSSQAIQQHDLFVRRKGGFVRLINLAVIPLVS